MSTSRRPAFALAALVLIAAPLAPALAGAQPPSPASGVAAGPMRAERHPEIRRAIRQLERARADLQNAAHDFGGHRAEALAATDNAIRQLQLALQYDRR